MPSTKVGRMIYVLCRLWPAEPPETRLYSKSKKKKPGKLMSSFAGSERCVLKCRFSDDSGVARPGDEKTASIGKTVYCSPPGEEVCQAVEGRGMTGSARPAQEAQV